MNIVFGEIYNYAGVPVIPLHAKMPSSKNEWLNKIVCVKNNRVGRVVSFLYSFLHNVFTILAFANARRMGMKQGQQFLPRWAIKIWMYPCGVTDKFGLTVCKDDLTNEQGN